MLESFATVAVNGWAVLTCKEAEDRDSEILIAGGGAAVTVMVAEDDFVGSPTLVALIDEGKIRPDSLVELARSGIGMAIKAGSSVPDISSLEALNRTLLAAKSIAYSSSASGVYLSNELFSKLGIAGQIKSKCRAIEGEPVGEAVASGDAEIGFQQISELLPVKGIVLVGPLPVGAQRITVIAAGIPTASKNPEAAQALIKFLASSAAAAAIRQSGLEPVNPK